MPQQIDLVVRFSRIFFSNMSCRDLDRKKEDAKNQPSVQRKWPMWRDKAGCQTWIVCKITGKRKEGEKTNERRLNKYINNKSWMRHLSSRSVTTICQTFLSVAIEILYYVGLHSSHKLIKNSRAQPTVKTQLLHKHPVGFSWKRENFFKK